MPADQIRWYLREATRASLKLLPGDTLIELKIRRPGELRLLFCYVTVAEALRMFGGSVGTVPLTNTSPAAPRARIARQRSVTGLTAAARRHRQRRGM